MKSLILVVTLLIGNASFAGESKTFQVEGMTCASCAGAIEKQVRKITEVDSVDISIKTGKVVVSAKDNQALSSAKIKKAIEDAGYNIKGDVPK